MKISVVFILLSTANIIFIIHTSEAETSEINEFKIDDIFKGVYSFRFKTPENIERNENGYLDDEGNLVVDGYYSYTDPDGKQQYVMYRADKDGYRTVKMPEIAVVSAGISPNIVASLLG